MDISSHVDIYTVTAFYLSYNTGLNKSRSSPNRAITASIHLEYMFRKLKCGNEILRAYRGQKSKTMSKKKKKQAEMLKELSQFGV